MPKCAEGVMGCSMENGTWTLASVVIILASLVMGTLEVSENGVTLMYNSWMVLVMEKPGKTLF